MLYYDLFVILTRRRRIWGWRGKHKSLHCAPLRSNDDIYFGELTHVSSRTWVTRSLAMQNSCCGKAASSLERSDRGSKAS